MFNRSSCDWKSQLSGILTEPLNPIVGQPCFCNLILSEDPCLIILTLYSYSYLLRIFLYLYPYFLGTPESLYSFYVDNPGYLFVTFVFFIGNPVSLFLFLFLSSIFYPVSNSIRVSLNPYSHILWGSLHLHIICLKYFFILIHWAHRSYSPTQIPTVRPTTLWNNRKTTDTQKMWRLQCTHIQFTL